jgi:hypothetical protein
MDEAQVTALYLKARSYLMAEDLYASEIKHVEKLRFAEQTPASFLSQYIYVVLNTGMKNQVAEAMYQRFLETGKDPSVIKHTCKSAAIRRALTSYESWFQELKAAPDKLSFLEALPFIGPVNKFHLARNLGIDVAKPDRHMIRLARRYGFNDDVQGMCRKVSESTGHRIGVVDVVLWRAANLGIITDLEEIVKLESE